MELDPSRLGTLELDGQWVPYVDLYDEPFMPTRIAVGFLCSDPLADAEVAFNVLHTIADFVDLLRDPLQIFVILVQRVEALIDFLELITQREEAGVGSGAQ